MPITRYDFGVNTSHNDTAAIFKLHAVLSKQIEQKISSQNKKIDRLCNAALNTIPPPVMSTKPNVVNQSTATLIHEEMEFLNLVLNYAIPPKTDPTVDIVTDIEVAIANLPFVAKENIRSECKEILAENRQILKNSNVPRRHNETLKSLNSKDIAIMKSNKGSAVVILDKMDYEDRLNEAIHRGHIRFI